MSQNTGHIPLSSDITMQPRQMCNTLEPPEQGAEAARDFLITFDPRVNQEPSSEMSLLQALTRIIEQLFDRDAPDPIIVQNMKSEMFVSIAVLCGHPYIRSLTADAELVVKAACASEKVVVDVENYIIKPMYKIERKTVILREIPPDADEQFIRGLFGAFGSHIKVINKGIDNIWFVSFESESNMLEAFFEVKKNKINDKPVQVRVKSENLLKATQYPGTDAIHAFYSYRYWLSGPTYATQTPYFSQDYDHVTDAHPTLNALSHAYFAVSQCNQSRKMHSLQMKKRNPQLDGYQTQNAVKRSLSTPELTGNTSKSNSGSHSKSNFCSSNHFSRRKNGNSVHKPNINHNNSGRSRIKLDSKKDPQKSNTAPPNNNNKRPVALSLAPSNFPPLASCRTSKSTPVYQRPLHKLSLIEQKNINTPNCIDTLSTTTNDDECSSLDNLVSNLQVQPNQVSSQHHPSQSRHTPPQAILTTAISESFSSSHSNQPTFPTVSHSQNKSSEPVSKVLQHSVSSPCPQTSSHPQSQNTLNTSSRPNTPIQSWAELLRSSINNTTRLNKISSS